MAHVRKNQKDLTPNEWDKFVDAFNKLHRNDAGNPDFDDFVKVHVKAMTTAEGMEWRVHSMDHGGHFMPGKNFLPWHRHYLASFEKRLRDVEPGVALPYWDAVENRSIPNELTDPSLLNKWEVSRSWNDDELPLEEDWQGTKKRKTFGAFQRRLEFMHNDVHVAVGGHMGSAESPKDPLFWLHHCNVDRLWAKWHKDNPQAKPNNLDEKLQPPPLFDLKVAKVLKTEDLGYTYA